MVINWVGLFVSVTCVLNTIGLIALNFRVRYLEKLQGDLILQQLIEESKYLGKTLNNMNKENNNDAN